VSRAVSCCDVLCQTMTITVLCYVIMLIPYNRSHSLFVYTPTIPVQVYDPKVDEDRGFGLLGDSDHLWTANERERQKAQVRVVHCRRC
jgi:hypothetical protein